MSGLFGILNSSEISSEFLDIEEDEEILFSLKNIKSKLLNTTASLFFRMVKMLYMFFLLYKFTSVLIKTKFVIILKYMLNQC